MKKLLIPLLGLVFGLSLAAHSAGGEERHETCVSVSASVPSEGRIVPVGWERQIPWATLRDDWQEGRLSGSRTVRVLPSHASGRSGGRALAIHKSNLLIPTFRHGGIPLRTLSFRACASCDRYYIALRHIIR